MLDLIFIGSGGAAAEVAAYVEDQRSAGLPARKIAGFLGPSEAEFLAAQERYGFTAGYLGDPEEYGYSTAYDYLVAFSNPLAKRALIDRLSTLGLSFPNIVHPSATVARSARLGHGNIVGPHCVIGPACEVGHFNLLTAYSFISHGCRLGSFNFFSTSGISGHARVGDANFFGIRATILPHVEVGNENVIQAGMIVDKSVGNRETVFYKYKERVQIIRG